MVSGNGMLALKHFEITAVRKKEPSFYVVYRVDVMRVDRDVFHFPWKVPIATLKQRASPLSKLFSQIFIAGSTGWIDTSMPSQI